MSGTIRVVMGCGVVTCSLVKVLMLVARGMRLVMRVRMLGQLSLGLNAKASNRAQHASCQCTPNGEQHGKQHKEPEAKGLHSS